MRRGRDGGLYRHGPETGRPERCTGRPGPHGGTRPGPAASSGVRCRVPGPAGVPVPHGARWVAGTGMVEFASGRRPLCPYRPGSDRRRAPL